MECRVAVDLCNKLNVALISLQQRSCRNIPLAVFFLSFLQQEPCCAHASATRTLLQNFFRPFFSPISATRALLHSAFCNNNLVAELFQTIFFLFDLCNMSFVAERLLQQESCCKNLSLQQEEERGPWMGRRVRPWTRDASVAAGDH